MGWAAFVCELTVAQGKLCFQHEAHVHVNNLPGLCQASPLVHSSQYSHVLQVNNVVVKKGELHCAAYRKVYHLSIQTYCLYQRRSQVKRVRRFSIGLEEA